MQKYDVAIIGGGASGLACAVTLKKLNGKLSVVVVEAGNRLGKKLAASGNGQGNVSNADMTPDHYHGSGKRLAEKLCCNNAYDPFTLFDFLFVTDALGRIYPAGKQASALSDCLIRKVNALGIETHLSTKAEAIERGFKLKLSDETVVFADKVVLAAGGKAQKQFNTDGSAYALAKALGHQLTPTYPSLIQLKCDMRHIKTLKGIRADCAVKAVDKGGKVLASTRGDVIFTDFGVSGNAIFYLSSYVSGREGVTLSLQFDPDICRNELVSDIKNKINSGYPESELLSGTLHNSVGRAIMKRVNSSDPEKIADIVQNFTLPVVGSLGFDYAQVTKGGVPADEIGDDLQSRKCANLYLAGEVIDVDGDCGGYNLHWAFASGMHAAKSIAESYE